MKITNKMTNMTLVGLLVLSCSSFAGNEEEQKKEKKELPVVPKKTNNEQGREEVIEKNEKEKPVDPYLIFDQNLLKINEEKKATGKRADILARVLEICKRDKIDLPKKTWENLNDYIKSGENLTRIEKLILYSKDNKEIDLDTLSKEHVEFIKQCVDLEANKKQDESDELVNRFASLKMNDHTFNKAKIIKGGTFLVLGLMVILNQHYNYTSPWRILAAGCGIEGARHYLEELGPFFWHLMAGCCGKKKLSTKEKKHN